MYSVWGFFGTCFKVPKTSSSDATGVAPSGLGCAAWRLGVCCLMTWGVLPGDKGKLKRLGTHGA